MARPPMPPSPYQPNGQMPPQMPPGMPPMGPGSSMPMGGAGAGNPISPGQMPPGPMGGIGPGIPSGPGDPTGGQMPMDPSMGPGPSAMSGPGPDANGYDPSTMPFPLEIGAPPPKPPEKIPAEFKSDEFFQKIKKWFQKDVEIRDKWAEEAEEDFKFYAGDQWSEEDRIVLEQQKRPVTQFNRIQPTIQVVSGSEISNRQEIHYYPRVLGKSAVSEVVSSAGKWFRDVSEAEDEESDAFRDTLIGGMGWAETRLDFEEDASGTPRTDRVSPFEMVWDANASKPNLIDAKRVFRVKDITIEDAQALAPDYTEDDPSCFDAKWAKNMMEIGLEGATLDRDKARLYQDQGRMATGDIYDDQEMVTIVELQWVSRQKGWVLPVMSGPNQTISDAEYKQMGRPKGAVPQVRLVRYKAIIGNEILSVTETPSPVAFSYQCITGLRDQSNNTWMGLVRAMKDPQRWANKFWSQTLHIINSQAKGGIMTERGVFEDDKKAEEMWAKADAIVYTKPGMMTQNKIQPRPGMQFPTGIWEMMQFSVESIRETTGINQEMLGLRGANQPGVLEYQRKQAGMTIIQSFFDSLRRYRKIVGKAMLWFIQNDLSDGRLIRVSESGADQYIPLIRDKTFGEYDLIIDEASSSPDIKEKVWNMVQPMFMQLPPQVQAEIIEYTPLPASLVAKIQATMQQLVAQGPPPDPETIKAQAQVQAMQQKAQMDSDIAMQKMQTDMQIQQQKMQAEVEAARQQALIETQKLNAQMQLDQQRMAHEQQMAEMRLEHEHILAQRKAEHQRQADFAKVGVQALGVVTNANSGNSGENSSSGDTGGA